MAGTNQGQPNASGDFKEYTSGTGFADTTTWASLPGDWIQIIGAGSTVIKTEAGLAAATPYNRTITTDSAEPNTTVVVKVATLVSSTATRVRIGYGPPPLTPQAPGNTNLNGATVPAGGALTTGNVLQVTAAGALYYAPVNLSGGANFVTGTPPKWATTSAQTTAFSAAIDSINYLTITSAVVAQLPALTGAIDMRAVSFFNNATSTAVITPTGSDLLAVSGGAGATAATAAGPTGGNMATYVAMTALGKWVKWA